MKKFLLLPILLFGLLVNAAWAADSTTEVYVTNNTDNDLIFTLTRDGYGGGEQSTTVPANGGTEVLYDYPTAWYLKYSYYNYTVKLQEENKSYSSCTVNFEVVNAYLLWPTIIECNYSSTPHSCSHYMQPNFLLYSCNVWVETQ